MQCEVYDVGGQLLDPTTPEEAFTMICDGRAYMIEAHPVRKFRTVSTSYDVPMVIGLRHKVKMGKKRREFAALNKLNIFIRDGFTCQYCGRHEYQLRKDEILNRDHVTPREKGGLNTWENLVTACSTCNGRKANLTLAECGMKLLSTPYRPTEEALRPIRDRFKAGKRRP